MIRASFLAERDRAALQRARVKLARLGHEATIDDVFAALIGAVPFAGGFLETYPEFRPWDAYHAPIRLPAGLPELIMARKPYEPQDALSVVTRAPVGSLTVDRDALPAETWKRVEGYQAIRRFGFGGGAAALKLRSSTGASGPEHTYLALFLHDGASTPSPTARALVCALAPAVRAALDRLAVPLLRRGQFIAQVIEEQVLGVAVVTETGVVCQANRMAYTLALEYAPSLGMAEARHLLRDFVGAALRMPCSPRDGRRHLTHPRPSVRRHLEISYHELDPDAYDLPERLGMLLLREILPFVEQTPRLVEALGELDNVEQKIVLAMVTTRVSNKQIAIDLRLNLRAFEKCVQRIADKLNIHVSRGSRVRPLLTRRLTSK